MSKVHITLNLRQARAFFKAQRMIGHFRYATARTLSNLAFDSREAIKADIKRTFVIRNPRYTFGSIVANAANKRNLTATVGSKSRYLAPHAEGRDRDKRGPLQSVPTKNVRTTPKVKTTVSKWPSRLLKKGQRYMDRYNARQARREELGKKRGRPPKPVPFILARKGRQPVLAIRQGKRLKILYRFPKRARIKHDWYPEKPVNFWVRRYLGPRFHVNADKALRTARLPRSDK